MGKFIKNVIAFSLKNKFFIIFMTALLLAVGIYTFKVMSIEAFPDVTNTQVTIVTQWSGRSAQEIERFVTIPLEVTLNSVQRKANLRSVSMFGVSIINIIFEDDVDDAFARAQVNNLVSTVELPEDIKPEVQPPYGPTGEIYRYVLQSKHLDTRELLTYQTFVIDRAIRAVPGIADINVYGGEQKIYQINVKPGMLQKYGMTPLEVYDAVSKSNVNVGGDVIERNNEAYVVRGLGLLNSVEDINNTVVKEINNTPIIVKNIADVVEAGYPRVGKVGWNEQDDVVEGDVLMRKGENAHVVLEALKAKVNELNTKILPPDVKIVTVYDRDNLMEYCTDTVMHNLLEGIILVTVIVFLFMADWRTTVIVSAVIPLSLLFAFICLRLKGMPANLLSLGAVDFGIIIDGAVVMVEGIFVVLDEIAKKEGMEKFNRLSKLGIIKRTGGELGKAIFFSKLIIITALIPIFAFQKVEGKMFSPLAYTLGFALIGALILTLTLVPLLISFMLRKNVREKHNIFVEGVQKGIMGAFNFVYRHKRGSMLTALLIMGLSIYSFKYLGTEFLPELNEGSLWVEAMLPMSTSLNATDTVVNKLRAKLRKFPEVQQVITQVGRSNDGVDPSGFYYMQALVALYPKEQWKRHISRDELIDKIDSSLKSYQGIVYNYSQPIMDNVEEAVAGINADLAVKVFGTDLEEMNNVADSVKKVLKNVRGIDDLGVMRNLGQPELSIVLDEKRMAAYGVTKADANAIVEMAVGGKAATQLYQGERKFDVVIRYPKEYRNSIDAISNIQVPTVTGHTIPLKEISDIKTSTGPSFIYRDNNTRFNAVKFTVRDRDLGSTIADAQKQVDAAFKLPKDIHLQWTGEFENQERATARLQQVVPISLVIIFVLLFITFGNVKDAGLVLLNVPFALIGGILALHITNTIFGISAGVGFIALFGICVQNGVILISVFKKNLQAKIPLEQSVKQGVSSRIRPVVMTALMAMIGLTPAALSTGIGSETQKPLAIVVIGGLVSATILTLLIFPLIVEWAYRNHFKEIYHARHEKMKQE